MPDALLVDGLQSHRFAYPTVVSGHVTIVESEYAPSAHVRHALMPVALEYLGTTQSTQVAAEEEPEDVENTVLAHVAANPCIRGPLSSHVTLHRLMVKVSYSMSMKSKVRLMSPVELMIHWQVRLLL